MNSIFLILLTALLSVVGLWNAISFTRAFYRLADSEGPVCPVGEGECRSVLEHTDARVFRIPNSVLGIGYYLFILVSSIIGLIGRRFPLVEVALGVTGLSLLFGFYLLYSLFVKVKIPCPG